jgi:uncharacterized membrane protein YgdD (TMEM256/DUF423 family)
MIQDAHAAGWRLISGLLGMTAVILGAVGAHAVSDIQAAASIERAALYQLIHAAVLLFSTLLSGKLASIARWAIFLGVCLFCGSIYAKYFLSLTQATQFAPSGGILLMCGWLAFSVSGFIACIKRR